MATKYNYIILSQEEPNTNVLWAKPSEDNKSIELLAFSSGKWRSLIGSEGKSAYEEAVERGFVGSFEEWLETMKGPKGDTGDQGLPGEQGPQGEAGKGIVSITYSSETPTETLYIMTFSDDSTYALSIPKGQKGDPGKDGADGKDGEDGQDGTSFTYADLTAAQKAEIAQPATEQAAIAAGHLATIQAALDGLDPSQSTEDAITTLTGQLADTKAEVDELVPKMDSLDSMIADGGASWNQEDCTVNGYVNYTTGAVSTSVSGYTNTGYLELSIEAKEYSYKTSWTGSSNGLAFYDDSKVYISGLKASDSTVTGTLPEGARYVRFTEKSGETTSFSVTGKGTKTWEKQLKDDILDDVNESFGDIGREYSKSFNNNDAIYSGYVKYSDGVLTSSSSFKCSDYIEVFGSSLKISCSFDSSSSGLCFYNENKVYISGVKQLTWTDHVVTIPSTAKYMRFSVKNGETVSVVLSVDGAEGLNKTIDALIEGSAGQSSKVIRHVLMFGNSFTTNGCANIATIASNCGLDGASSLQTIIMGGSSLQYWATQTDISGANKTTQFGAGLSTSNSMNTLLSRAWDVIVFQQVSDDSGSYSTFMPYIATLIHKAKTLCVNKNVRIAFNMTWESKSVSYASIVSAAKSLKEDFGDNIDIVIPSGTAIQNIRQTSLAEGNSDFSYNTPKWHLSEGVGEYVAGCCLFQSLFGDMIEGSIYDDTTSVAATSNVGSVAVDDNNRTLCQKAAMYACISPFQSVNVDNV